MPESLETLEEVYKYRSQLEYQEYLKSCLEVTPSISIVLTLAKSIREAEGDEAVAKFIASHLKKNPTIRGLTKLIDLISTTHEHREENLAILRSLRKLSLLTNLHTAVILVVLMENECTGSVPSAMIGRPSNPFLG